MLLTLKVARTSVLARVEMFVSWAGSRMKDKTIALRSFSRKEAVSRPRRPQPSLTKSHLFRPRKRKN